MGRLLMLAGVALLALDVHAGTIIGSRHDLSDPYGGGADGVCVYCHTPHHANVNSGIAGSPLWNRAETTATFTLYGSPTINTTVSQPRVPSRLCLGCHDGVLATANVNGFIVDSKHDLVSPPGASRPDLSTYPNCERCHSDFYGGRRKLVLGTNLGNDHPISMPYPTPAQDAFFNTPPSASSGWGGAAQGDVKLYGGNVECGSCHNVHDPGIDGRFLRKSNTGSALCATCHKK